MKTLLLIFFSLYGFQTFAQTNEGYSLPPYILDPQQQAVPSVVNSGVYNWHMGSELIQGPLNYEVHQTGRVEFKSSQRITIRGPFKATGLSSNGRFRAYIEPDPFEVKLIEEMPNGSVGRYEKVEFGIRPPQNILNAIDVFLNYNQLPEGQYQLNGWQSLGGINPFLQWEIEVTGIFETMDALGGVLLETRKVDAFYFKDYLQTTPQPGPTDSFAWVEDSTDLPFRLRFAPTELGSVRCKFKIKIPNAPEMETGYYFFDVVDTGEKGYVQVGQSGRFLTRDGETFFPIGRNLIGPHCAACEDNALPYGYSAGGGGWLQRTYAPEAYHLFLRDIQQVHDNGGRYFRMMSIASTLEIEFERLGNYTDRLHIAHELDRIFDKVDDLDMMLQWDLSSNTPFNQRVSRETQWDWLENSECGYQANFGAGDYIDRPYCYKDELGLQHALDFLESDDAFKYYEQRIRYLISRWGYSNNIAAISFMNEMDSYGTEAIASAPPACQDIGRYEPYLGGHKDNLSGDVWYDGNPY